MSTRAERAERPDLSIIIVTYNCRMLALSCLQRLSEHPPAVDHEVIVFDNASLDEGVESIAQGFPHVRLLQSERNLGFGAGVNRAAEDSRGRRILLLNPDAFVSEGTIDQLWGFAEREPRRGIWGGRTLFDDGSLNPSSCWGRITLWSLFCASTGLSSIYRDNRWLNPEGYGGWARDTERPVDIVTGCFLLIDAALYWRLNGFDPLFFMYGEEADLCLRARLLGAEPAITPRAQLVHLSGGCARSIEDEIVGVTRARITLIRKHWRGWRFRTGRSMIILSVWARSLAWMLAATAPAPTRMRPDWQRIWRRRAEWRNGYGAPG